MGLNNVCVLVSGGMDSVAALHWARQQSPLKLRAIGFHYGQPNRDDETTVAQLICRDLGVEHTLIALASAMHTGVGLIRGVTDHDSSAGGISRAFMPGRNGVFLALAAAHAATWFPVGRIDLVIGSCADDARGFPDCRENFMVATERMLTLGTGRDIRVVAPYVKMSKRDIVRSFVGEGSAADAWTIEAREVLADISRSYSCYRGGIPCGSCTPCVLRRDAFQSLVELPGGLPDRAKLAAMHGGDTLRGKGSK